jgi:TonB family protein
MKKILVVLALVMSAMGVMGQENYNKRVIFLWDVTYSMHGGYFGTSGDQYVKIAGQSHLIKQYNEKYDIYDDALNVLCKYIDHTKNTSDTIVELVVIPYGNDVLDVWRYPATVEGKAELTKKICDFCELSPKKVQATNIGGALQFVKEKVNTADCANTLYLMTDGRENVDKQRFYYMLDTWCEFARERNIRGYYFALTEHALDKNLKERLSKTCFEMKTPIDLDAELEDEETIFMVVETMPEFPGGQQALFKYLAENVKYPVIAQENGIQGRVICQFVVNKDGSIVDVVAVRSSGEASLDKEAIRVIKSMPKWKPGKQRGKPVRVKYTVPINFRLTDESTTQNKKQLIL